MAQTGTGEICLTSATIASGMPPYMTAIAIAQHVERGPSAARETPKSLVQNSEIKIQAALPIVGLVRWKWMLLDVVRHCPTWTAGRDFAIENGRNAGG
jgi:hypothetical protein